MATATWRDHAIDQEAVLARFGFRFGDTGMHTSRTMMLAELVDLLAALPRSATRDDYRSAIVEHNVLGKSTNASRRLTNQRLGELYGLDPAIPVFRVLRRLWDLDEDGRPLVAMMCALTRDPLLRARARVRCRARSPARMRRRAPWPDGG